MPSAVRRRRAERRSAERRRGDQLVQADAQVAMDEQTLAELQALGYVAGNAALAFDDERAALEVVGPDPSTRIDDLQTLTKAWGHLASGRCEQALELLREQGRRREQVAVLDAGKDSCSGSAMGAQRSQRRWIGVWTSCCILGRTPSPGGQRFTGCSRAP